MPGPFREDLSLARSPSQRPSNEREAEEASPTPRNSNEMQEKDKEEDDGPSSPELKREKTIWISEKMSLFQEFLFVTIVCLSQLMTQAAIGQTLSILHVIGDSFGLTNPGDLSWLIAGYSLTVGTFILVAGRFGDMYGYKRMLLGGYVWFALWSMIAGLAVYSNHVLFVFARVLGGIGPAFSCTNGLALLGASYPQGPRKDMVFAIFGATAPTGSILGAVFAALFSLAWWPWAFWSFAIALMVMTVIGVFVIPDPPPKKAKEGGEKHSLREAFHELDVLGGLVGITALVLLNFAWNQAGVVGWAPCYVYICLIIGILLFPVFFYIELKVARSPLIPFDALNTTTAFVLGCIACGWMNFGITIYYVWNFIELLRHASPILASAWICPMALSGIVASISTGFLLSRIRPAWVMFIALTAFTVGTIIIGTAPVDQVYWAQLFVFTLVLTFGMDMSFPAATVILSNAVPKEHQGIASSLVNTVVNYSISLSLGIAATVEINVNNGGKTDADLLKGYRGAWYLAIGFSGFGMFLSILFLLKVYGILGKFTPAPKIDQLNYAEDTVRWNNEEDNV